MCFFSLWFISESGVDGVDVLGFGEAAPPAAKPKPGELLQAGNLRALSKRPVLCCYVGTYSVGQSLTLSPRSRFEHVVSCLCGRKQPGYRNISCFMDLCLCYSASLNPLSLMTYDLQYSVTWTLHILTEQD